MLAAHARQLVKPLVPEALERARIRRAWKRPEPATWPVPEHVARANTHGSTWPAPDRAARAGIHRFEYSRFSQNGEDGLLRYVFSCIGFGSRRFVEIGFTPRQSNSLRLVLAERFRGVFVDRSASAVARFNAVADSAGLEGVSAVNAFLDRENVDATLLAAGAGGEIDLLSIDVDGNDYWLWDAIEAVSARVVVIEYNAAFGPERSVTVPYEPRFERHAKHASGFYCGASITALERLARRKGYALVACDSAGVNALFVRRDCVTSGIEPVTPAEAWRPHKRRLERGFSTERQLAMIAELPLEHV